MGFFHWIREGVRQAVLLGVSDAVTEIGNRQPDEDLGEHLAAALRQNLTVETEPKPATGTAPGGARKRLGKSLEQIRDAQRPQPVLKKGTGTSRQREILGEIDRSLGASPLFQREAKDEG